MLISVSFRGVPFALSSIVTAFTQRNIAHLARHALTGIRSIRSQGRPAPSFYRTTRSHYKLHELCKTPDYSIYMYYHIIICIILLAVSQV